ncbi:MAG: hypothetical protein EBV03_12175, partial [Proteobacteria bacterium]|nr:hypothetical protein [Pseudomonadota bacterium]
MVHWQVLIAASEMAAACGGATVSRIIETNRAAALLGATAHDAPYYYRGGEHSFAKVANGLHGLRGSDTFAPLRQLAAAIVKSPEQDL